MLLNYACSQIAFPIVASNTYGAIIVGQVEVGLIQQKHYILPISTRVTAFMCSLLSKALVVSVQWNPTFKRWHRSRTVTVFQCRFNTMDEAVQSIMTTMWSELNGTAPAHLCIQPFCIFTGSTHASLSYQHAPYELKCHSMTNLLPREQSFCLVWTYSHANIMPFHIEKAYLHYL